jgi:hypothetical protein
VSKPARKIRTKHFQGIRGYTPEGEQFEFLLENDYLVLLRFDPDVERYRTQPCKINYDDGTLQRHYTPDVLVEYKRPRTRVPELIEIKPRDFADDPMYSARFDAARAYAAERDWVFRVVTESDVPPARLDNAKFLLRYVNRPLDEAFSALALQSLQEFQQVSVDGFVQMCQQHEENRAKLLTEVWTLIAKRRVGADLDAPLTMQSPIWATEEHQTCTN